MRIAARQVERVGSTAGRDLMGIEYTAVLRDRSLIPQQIRRRIQGAVAGLLPAARIDRLPPASTLSVSPFFSRIA